MNETTTSVRRGFNCPCIKCGETGGIRIYLDDVTGVESCISCLQCDAEYNLGDVKAAVASWQKVITWLESAPEFVDE